MGLPAVFPKKNFPGSYVINLLLTKPVQSRWLDIGLVLFFSRVYGPKRNKHAKKNLANILSYYMASSASGKMNEIVRCDWLPERARWSDLARLGLPAVFRKQNFTKSHIINPLLTKFVRSRWLDIGLVLFLRVYGPRLRLGP